MFFRVEKHFKKQLLSYFLKSPYSMQNNSIISELVKNYEEKKI
jgi:hypothetical protein